jgi:hypothetical protein
MTDHAALTVIHHRFRRASAFGHVATVGAFIGIVSGYLPLVLAALCIQMVSLSAMVRLLKQRDALLDNSPK